MKERSSSSQIMTNETEMKSLTKVIVVPQNGKFHLRTSNGFPIGSRMLTVAPETGKDYPELKSEFSSRHDASRAALEWNLYLSMAAKKKSKSKQRFAD